MNRIETATPTSLTLFIPILIGKGEAWRRYLQELSESRLNDYEASRQQLGILKECAWIIETSKWATAVIYQETLAPEKAIHSLLLSSAAFDKELKTQLIYVQQANPFNQKISAELLFTWPNQG